MAWCLLYPYSNLDNFDPKQIVWKMSRESTTRFDESEEGSREKREDYEYVRNGVCNIFIANDRWKVNVT